MKIVKISTKKIIDEYKPPTIDKIACIVFVVIVLSNDEIVRKHC